jgi:hypothetical protein
MEPTTHTANVLDALAGIRAASRIKGKRNFADYFADRIVQASTEPTLLAMLNRLYGLVDADPDAGKWHIANIVAASGSEEAPRILAWVRKFPKIAAMIAMLKHEERAEVAKGIVLDVEPDGVGQMPARSGWDIAVRAELTAPMSHGADQKAGNATLFRRMQVLAPDGQIMELPFYAGNALRGQIRDILADHFLRSLGLTARRDAPPVAVWFFHALYAGGALEEDSAATKALNAELGAASGALKGGGVKNLRDHIPPLSLLGCALGNRVLPGRLQVSDLRPVCREWGTGATPAAELMTWQFLTRREDHEGRSDDDKHSGMITNTECLRAGAEMEGGIDHDGHIQEMELACLGVACREMTKLGFIGAENRRGFGRCRIEFENAPDPAPYEEWLAENKADILAYLEKLAAIPQKSGSTATKDDGIDY